MDAVVSIGENVQINEEAMFTSRLLIMSLLVDTLIASKVFISDHNHGIF